MLQYSLLKYKRPVGLAHLCHREPV